MTAKGLGVSGRRSMPTGKRLVGIYTDGDLRRTFEKMPDIENARSRTS